MMGQPRGESLVLPELLAEQTARTIEAGRAGRGVDDAKNGSNGAASFRCVGLSFTRRLCEYTSLGNPSLARQLGAFASAYSHKSAAPALGRVPSSAPRRAI